MDGAIYKLSITLGIGVAVYLYGFSFDQLSEEQLISYSPFWLLPIIYGVYGFVAISLIDLIKQGEAKTLAAAAFIFSSAIPVIGILLLFPFFFIKGDSPVRMAFIATLIWAVLLILFFQLVFPLL